MYTGFIWSSIWSIRWLLWLGIFLSSWETMSFLSGLLFQSNYLTWKSITLFQKIRIQCTELWWLVDRGSQYNLGWFPTWCTKFLFIFFLFLYNAFIKILYIFRALPSHLQEVYVVIVQGVQLKNGPLTNTWIFHVRCYL